jgi:hypothetical protein
VNDGNFEQCFVVVEFRVGCGFRPVRPAVSVSTAARTTEHGDTFRVSAAEGTIFFAGAGEKAFREYSFKL